MAKKRALSKDDPRHGTYNGWANYRCQCEPCKAAGVRYHEEYRTKIRKKALAEDDHRHGTVNAYTNYGCRCDKCKQAKSDDKKSRRQAKLERTENNDDQ